jgi:putative flavoprotein involved in K+ transport
MTSDSVHHFDTVVIGGGQAGLAMGYYLIQQDRDFVILDASERVGDTWRNRWESLRLFSSAQYSSLPGLSFPASDDYFPTKDEMAEYLEAYAARFNLPIRLDIKVNSLSRNSEHYVIDADSQRVLADHVVVATGPFHHPNVPAFADELNPALTQIHSSEYQTPDQLPDDDVLVVGAGNSGAEIAVELAATGRRTYLSGRDTGHIPLGLFNTRVFWWLFGSVLSGETWIGQKLKERAQGRGDPLIRLTSTDIRRAGVERVPRTKDVADGKPRLADGQVLDVAGVVWATGFRPAFSWIEVPELSIVEDGYPAHYRGKVDGVPGLYVLGLPYQHTLVSATIGGVAADARYIADHIRTQTDSNDAAPQPEVMDINTG